MAGEGNCHVTSQKIKLSLLQPWGIGRTILDMDSCRSFTITEKKNLTSMKIIIEEAKIESMKSLLMIIDTTKLRET